MAKKEWIIIDPYFADSVLPLIAQKKKMLKFLLSKIHAANFFMMSMLRNLMRSMRTRLQHRKCTLY